MLHILFDWLVEMDVPGYEGFTTVQIVTIETTDIENDQELVDLADTKEDEIPEL